MPSCAAITGRSPPPSQRAQAAENAFGVWDVFFWRETPDWYNKTFLSAGFMLSFAALRQYLDRCVRC
jgi:hypothetical protein